MASDISGPPPGFETDDVGFHEPPAGLPPPPSFGGGDRAEADSDVKSGKPDDDTSREFFDKSDAGARRHQASEGTRREWQWGERTSLSGEDGKVRDDGRSNWSSTAAASGGSEIWTRRRHEDDPWSSGGDPWQRDYGRHRESGERRHDDAMEPWGSHRWSDGRDDRHRVHDHGGFRGAPWADGHRAHGGLDLGSFQWDTKDDGRDNRHRVHDRGGFQGAPRADGRDSAFRLHDQGDLHRWTDSYGGGSDSGLRSEGWQSYTGWQQDHTSQLGWGVWQSFEDQGKGPRPSERLTVPTFTAEDSEDLGNSARSYLRQIEVWKRITRLPPSQLGLVLYQHLGGKAWIAAEELSVARLSTNEGLAYFTSWISARFLDLEVARIGRAFSDFFRKLRRRPGQTVREYNSEYDRLHGRLREVGCSLPEECAAWLYIDRLQLDESQELNLLASVGNRYNLHHLQHAAVLHDRGQRKPWEGNGARPRRTNFAHMTDHTAETDEEDPFDGEDAVPEDVAEAFMTYQSAKERYRNQQRSRGTTGGGNGGDKAPKGDGHSEDRKPSEHRDADRETKLKAMKARSFCGGCGRKGHWHKDDVCPLNRGGDNAKGEASANVAMTTVLPADVFALKHVPSSLLGVADTACARTVAGTQWLQSYSNLLAEIGTRPVLQKECEAYRFGTGKVHYSSFYVVVTFRLGGYNIQVRTSIITGDIPLLLSKTVLGKLGMIYDVENGKADFRAINLKDYVLTTTTSGHPAIPIVPVSLPADKMSDLQIEDLRLQTAEQYMSVCAVAHQGPQVPKYFGIFYEKKLDPSTRIMLSEDRLQRDVFVAWWEKANFDRDFWVETPNTWVRVHMVPRRALFNPSTWRTGSTVQRDMLTASIGNVRSTEGVCCKSGSWLEDVIDQWEFGQVVQPSHPLLWVGRTVFYKAPAPGPDLRAPDHGHGLRAMPEFLGAGESHDEVPAVGRGSASGGNSAPLLDGPRTSSHDQGPRRHFHGEVCEPKDEGTQLDEARRAGGEGKGDGRGCAGSRDQRESPAVGADGSGDYRRHRDDHRAMEGVSVPGNSSVLRSVGPRGDNADGQFIPGADHVCEMVGNADACKGKQDGDQGRRERVRGDGPELPDLDAIKGISEREPSEHPPHFNAIEGVRKREPGEHPPHSNVIEGVLGRSEPILHQGVCEPRGQREYQGDAQAQQLRPQGEERAHHGLPAGPRDPCRDPSPGDQAGPVEGQGPEHECVSTAAGTCGGDAGDGPPSATKSIRCCGVVYDQDCIAEDDYVKGHYNQNTNYNASRYEVVNKDGTPGCRGHNNKHHEHNESQPGARQQLPHPRYGDESFDWADTSFENCQKILEETLAASATGPKRPIQHGEGDDQAHAYVTYGMFTHGGVHGTTRATKEDDGLIQYLNHFGRQHLGEEATWTSISVTRNIACDTHRDSNNLRDTYNYATSFGQRAGGDLWLEEDVDENHANDRDIVWKKDRTGSWVPGKYHKTKNMIFSPFLGPGRAQDGA